MNKHKWSHGERQECKKCGVFMWDARETVCRTEEEREILQQIRVLVMTNMGRAYHTIERDVADQWEILRLCEIGIEGRSLILARAGEAK